LSGEYLVIAVASSAPPILNPNALIQPRFAKSPVATPALAIMNLTVWSFPPTLRFISDLLSMSCAIMDAEWCVHAAHIRTASSSQNALYETLHVLVMRALPVDAIAGWANAELVIVEAGVQNEAAVLEWRA
jgi:hypothetical protein